MTPTRARRAAFRAAAVAALLALPGCAGLQTITAVTTPNELFDLSPKSTFDPGLPRVTAQIVVDEPTAANYVNTDRIAVKNGAYMVEYFPGVRWVDRAPRMVQVLLVESLENSGAASAVGREAIGLSSDYTLVTDLREFQAIAELVEAQGELRPSEQPVEVLVQLNIKIVQEPEGLIVGSESFERRLRAPSNEMLDVVATFDEALGKAMRDAVEWSVRSIHATPRRSLY